MSLTDVLAAIAILLSGGTAYATLYFQYFQRRRVGVALGDHIYLAYGAATDNGGYEDLGFYLSISLINAGATDALVTVMTASIRDSAGGSPIHLRWNSLIDSADAGTPGKSSSPTWTFKGWVKPLASTSRQVVTEWVYFSSTDSVASALTIGTYDFQLAVTEIRPKGGRARDNTTDDADRRQLAVWHGDFAIDEWACGYLKQDCIAADGWAPSTCPIALAHRQRAGLRPARVESP